MSVKETFGSTAAIDLGLVPVGHIPSQARRGSQSDVTGQGCESAEVNKCVRTCELGDGVGQFNLPEFERERPARCGPETGLCLPFRPWATAAIADAIQGRLEDEQNSAQRLTLQGYRRRSDPGRPAMYGKQASLPASLQLMAKDL